MTRSKDVLGWCSMNEVEKTMKNLTNFQKQEGNTFIRLLNTKFEISKI